MAWNGNKNEKRTSSALDYQTLGALLPLPSPPLVACMGARVKAIHRRQGDFEASFEAIFSHCMHHAETLQDLGHLHLLFAFREVRTFRDKTCPIHASQLPQVARSSLKATSLPRTGPSFRLQKEPELK